MSRPGESSTPSLEAVRSRAESCLERAASLARPAHACVAGSCETKLTHFPRMSWDLWPTRGFGSVAASWRAVLVDTDIRRRWLAICRRVASFAMLCTGVGGGGGRSCVTPRSLWPCSDSTPWTHHLLCAAGTSPRRISLFTGITPSRAVRARARRSGRRCFTRCAGQLCPPPQLSAGSAGCCRLGRTRFPAPLRDRGARAAARALRGPYVSRRAKNGRVPYRAARGAWHAAPPAKSVAACFV